MQCLDCGKKLGQADLLAVSCQECGEPLMPEDVTKLEASLGIIHKAPEIEAPVLLPEGGVHIPKVLDCKNSKCSMPLYGDEISGYLQGTPCQYCGKIDPEAPSSKGHETEHSQGIPNTESKVTGENIPSELQTSEVPTPVIKEGVPFTGSTLRTRFCTGPLAGAEFDLPTGLIIGRQFFNDIIAAVSKTKGTNVNWYKKSISRISREHFQVKEDGTVTDMGSLGGTILDRDEVFGEGDKFVLGKILNLADELFLTRVKSKDDGPVLRITNIMTNIAIDVPAEKEFHLGRWRDDGRREPFALAVADHMKRTDGMNEENIRRISRRHVLVTLKNDNSIHIQNIDGKKVSIETDWEDPESVAQHAVLNEERTEITLINNVMLEIGKSQYSIRRWL